MPVYGELAELLLSRGEGDEADRLYRRVIRGAPDEELVARAARLSMQINLGNGTLESLEQELLPLAIGNPQRPIYRRLLVEIYGNLTFGLVQRVKRGARRSGVTRRREAARAALARIGARAVKPLLDALADTDASQQRIAIDVLGYVENRNAGSALFAFATGGADTALRVRAMVACGMLRDPALLPKYRRAPGARRGPPDGQRRRRRALGRRADGRTSARRPAPPQHREARDAGDARARRARARRAPRPRDRRGTWRSWRRESGAGSVGARGGRVRARRDRQRGGSRDAPLARRRARRARRARWRSSRSPECPPRRRRWRTRRTRSTRSPMRSSTGGDPESPRDLAAAEGITARRCRGAHVARGPRRRRGCATRRRPRRTSISDPFAPLDRHGRRRRHSRAARPDRLHPRGARRNARAVRGADRARGGLRARDSRRPGARGSRRDGRGGRRVPAVRRRRPTADGAGARRGARNRAGARAEPRRISRSKPEVIVQLARSANPTATAAVVRALSDPDETVQRTALSAIGAHADRDAVAEVARILFTPRELGDARPRGASDGTARRARAPAPPPSRPCARRRPTTPTPSCARRPSPRSRRSTPTRRAPLRARWRRADAEPRVRDAAQRIASTP